MLLYNCSSQTYPTGDDLKTCPDPHREAGIALAVGYCNSSYGVSGEERARQSRTRRYLHARSLMLEASMHFDDSGRMHNA